MTNDQRQRRGQLWVLVAVVAWSLSGLFTRVITADSATILFWRSAFGAGGIALLLVLFPAMGGLRSFGKLGRPGMAYAAITSFAMLCFISALKQTTVAHVAIITATVPFFAAYLGWVVLREAPSRSQVLASLIALVGVALMVQPGEEGGLRGDLLALAMAFCMAAMILMSRRFAGIPAMPATCVASLMTALATAPFAALTTVSESDMTLLLVFAVVNQFVGFGLFAIGTRYLPAVQSALIAALEAPLAPLWVWLVLAEVPATATLVGGSLVLAAVFADIAGSQRRR